MPGTVCVRLPINSYESLFGYLARVADANGYDRSTWLLPAGQRTWFNTSTWTKQTIEHVAQITSLPTVEISSRIYANFGKGKRLFFGDRISTELIDQRGQKGTQKFCPACLREIGFHSALFDLVLVQICPIHGCRLTNVCPHCQKKVFWGQPTLITCTGCGGDLTTAQTEKIPFNELFGINTAVKRLGFPQSHSNINSEDLDLASELGHLSTGEIIELMITLAGYLGHRSNRSSFLNFTPQMKASLHMSLNTALPFLLRWPDGFFEFMNLYAATQSLTEQKAYGLNKSFGKFRVFLAAQIEEPWLTVQASYSNYIENEWTGNSVPRSKQHFGRVSINDVSRILGFSLPKIHTLIRLGILCGKPTGNWRGAPIFIERADIEKIAPKGQKPLRLMEIGQRLGLNRKRQRQFLDAGIITAILGPQIDGSKVYLFNPAQADDIFNDFSAQLSVTAATTCRKRPFTDVLKSQSLRKIPLKILIDAIRCGRLPPLCICPKKAGLSAFLFSRDTAIRVLAELEEETSYRAAASALKHPIAC
jgi:hypothetical protein